MGYCLLIHGRNRSGVGEVNMIYMVKCMVRIIYKRFKAWKSIRVTTSYNWENKLIDRRKMHWDEGIGV